MLDQNTYNKTLILCLENEHDTEKENRVRWN